MVKISIFFFLENIFIISISFSMTENLIYQTINFLRIVTVILLKVLRCYYNIKLDFYASFSDIFLLFMFMSSSLSFANTASFARLYFFYCDPEVLHFSLPKRSSRILAFCNFMQWKRVEIKYIFFFIHEWKKGFAAFILKLFYFSFRGLSLIKSINENLWVQCQTEWKGFWETKKFIFDWS